MLMIYHQENANVLKQQKSNSTHLEQPKTKTLTPPNAVKDAGQQQLSFIAGGNSKRSYHIGRQFGGPHKTKHTTAIQFINCAPWYLLKVVENLCPYKKKIFIQMFIVSLSIIANTQK